MGDILLGGLKIAVYGVATACAVLLIGGAIKKVLSDPADDCIDAGRELAQVLVGPAALALGGRAADELPPI